MHQSPIYLLSTVVSLAGLILLWQYGVQFLLLDQLRCRLAELHNDLYAVADAEGMERSHRVFQDFDTILSALIKHSHKLSYAEFRLMREYHERVSREEPETIDRVARLQDDLATMNNVVSGRLTHILIHMQRALALYVVLSSPAILLRYIAKISSYLFGLMWKRVRASLAQLLRDDLLPVWNAVFADTRIMMAEVVERGVLLQANKLDRKPAKSFQLSAAGVPW